MAIKEVIIYGAISAVFSAIRVVLSPAKPTFLEYLVAAFVSVPVGMIAGFVALDYGVEQGMAFAIVAAAALVAENIVKLLLALTLRLQKDPEGTIKSFRNLIKGN